MRLIFWVAGIGFSLSVVGCASKDESSSQVQARHHEAGASDVQRNRVETLSSGANCSLDETGAYSSAGCADIAQEVLHLAQPQRFHVSCYRWGLESIKWAVEFEMDGYRKRLTGLTEPQAILLAKEIEDIAPGCRITILGPA